MIIRKKSMVSGKVHEMDLPITHEQFQEWFYNPKRRMVQDIFPHLSNEEREFLMTGITPTEWAQVIKDDDNGN